MHADKKQNLDTQLTSQVVNYIRAKIEEGTLKPGDRIPPERELAKELKISRASLRMGIGYLAAMGVMKVRHGVGTFVADGPAEFGKSSLGLLGALHGFKSWQMFEVRNLLETTLAALAAERETKALPALAEEVAEMTPPSTTRRVPDPRCALSSHHRPGFRQPDSRGFDGNHFNGAVRRPPPDCGTRDRP